MKVVILDRGSTLGAMLQAALEPLHYKVDRHELLAGQPVIDGIDEILSGANAVFILHPGANLPHEKVEARMTEIMSAAARAGVRRAILLSNTVVYSDTASGDGTIRETAPIHEDDETASEAARFAVRIEKAFFAAADDNLERVTLRVPMLYDRADPDALSELRAIMIEGKKACLPGAFQRLHPADLCSALVSAMRVSSASGQIFNIAETTAISPDVLVAELQRLGRLLSDPNATEDRVRPSYPFEEPKFATDKASRILDFRPQRSTWSSLAECAQEIIFDLRREGHVADNTPKLPAVIAAIETRRKPLEGKVCVVTGATSGIGRDLAVLLSRLGAHVVAVGRNTEAGASLLQELDDRPTCTPGEFYAADLSRSSEVKKLAEALVKRHTDIHALFNNAGALFGSRVMTPEGIEATFAVNYLAAFHLTTRILKVISKEGHIVNLCSEAHRRSGLDFGDLFSSANYQPLEAYARAKFALMMFSNALTQRLDRNGPRVLTISPGAVRTEILNRNDLKDRPELAVFNRARNRMISPEKSASFVANLIIDQDLRAKTGIYMDQDKEVEIASATTDPAACAHLWRVSEALVEMTLAVPVPEVS